MATKVHIVLPRAMRDDSEIRDALLGLLRKKYELTDINHSRILMFGILTGDMPEDLVGGLHSLKVQGLIESFTRDEVRSV